jgi:hypothetical protein
VDKGSIPNGGEMAKPIPPLKPTPQEGGEEAAAEEEDAAFSDSFAASQSIAPLPLKKGTVPNPGEMKYTSQDLQSIMKESIANNKATQLVNGMSKSIQDSFKYVDGKLISIQEQGGWVIRDPATGALSLERIPGGDIISVDALKKGAVDSMGISFPKTIPENAIGTLHTHPGVLAGQTMGPSIDDVYMSNTTKLPGIIMGQNVENGKKAIMIFDNKTEGWY